MVNPLKGEARIDVDNVVYTLTFDVETIIAIEEELGKGWPRIIKELTSEDTMSFGLLRAMMWAALKPRHPNITRQDASRVISAVGGFEKALNKVLEAFQAAFPPPDTTANPQAPSQTAMTGSGS